jgi:hypothetical protein
MQSLTLGEEHKLQTFEIKVKGNIWTTRGASKCRDNLCYSPSTVRVLKLKGVWQVGHVAWVVETKNNAEFWWGNMLKTALKRWRIILKCKFIK